MTNEEAINSFKEELKTREDAYYDYLQSGGKGDCAEEYYHKILAMAIEALENQIPALAKYEATNNIFGAYKRTCQACGDAVMVSPNARPLEKYCRYCGKMLLDWSEIDDKER